MLNPKDLLDIFQKNEYRFFCGVPDSTIKYFCSYVEDHLKDHHICANEGAAIGQAIGYHLATKKVPIVYMQNSGFSNCLNPILSMASSDIYKIPMIIIVGWRGEPGIKDEPQHIHQGKVLLPSMGAMELDYEILPTKKDSVQKMISEMTTSLEHNPRPYFLVVKRNSFEVYDSKNTDKQFKLNRPEILKELFTNFPESRYIASTGFVARELYQLRDELGLDHNKDFLTIGAMGHANQIAYSYAHFSGKKTLCLDGDGSLIMHLGSLTSIHDFKKDPIIHIVFNNKSHLSVGGQPTKGALIDFSKIAKSCGFKNTFCIENKKQLKEVLNKAKDISDAVFIEIKVSSKTLNELKRPDLSPIEQKQLFMEKL